MTQMEVDGVWADQHTLVSRLLKGVYLTADQQPLDTLAPGM